MDRDDTKPDFAALLTSRLCHDLLSPISALHNAVELMEEEDSKELHAQAMSLIGDSARQAAHKLSFFRIAFGSAGGSGKTEARAVKEAASGYMSDQRANLSWRCSMPDMTLKRAKIALNLLLLMAAALPRGGEVILSVDEEKIGVAAIGDRLIFDEAIDGLLTGATRADNSREIVADLIARLVEEEGGQLDVSRLDGQISVSVQFGVAAAA